ncbi:MAG TPA: hypothetical protein VGC79_27640, partial [Polyangiaceae bacterium]
KPSVQMAQVGQRRILDRVFDGLSEWLGTVHDPQRYPGLLAHIWEVNHQQARRKYGSEVKSVWPMLIYRTTADFIASLTEVQIVAIDRQLTGYADSPVLGDWII